MNISNVAYDELESAYLLCKNLYILLQTIQTFLQPVAETYCFQFFLSNSQKIAKIKQFDRQNFLFMQQQGDSPQELLGMPQHDALCVLKNSEETEQVKDKKRRCRSKKQKNKNICSS